MLASVQSRSDRPLSKSRKIRDLPTFAKSKISLSPPRPPTSSPTDCVARFAALLIPRTLAGVAARPLRGSPPGQRAPTQSTDLRESGVYRLGGTGRGRPVVRCNDVSDDERSSSSAGGNLRPPQPTEGRRGASFERREASFVITRGLCPLGRQRVRSVEREGLPKALRLLRRSSVSEPLYSALVVTSQPSSVTITVCSFWLTIEPSSSCRTG